MQDVRATQNAERKGLSFFRRSRAPTPSPDNKSSRFTLFRNNGRRSGAVLDNDVFARPLVGHTRVSGVLRARHDVRVQLALAGLSVALGPPHSDGVVREREHVRKAPLIVMAEPFSKTFLQRPQIFLLIYVPALPHCPPMEKRLNPRQHDNRPRDLPTFLTLP